MKGRACLPAYFRFIKKCIRGPQIRVSFCEMCFTKNDRFHSLDMPLLVVRTCKYDWMCILNHKFIVETEDEPKQNDRSKLAPVASLTCFMKRLCGFVTQRKKEGPSFASRASFERWSSLSPLTSAAPVVFLRIRKFFAYITTTCLQTTSVLLFGQCLLDEETILVQLYTIQFYDLPVKKIVQRICWTDTVEICPRCLLWKIA